LDALTRQRRRAGKSFGLRIDFARDFGTPRRQVTCHIEFDRHEVDAAHFTDALRELPGPAAGLATEDRLQRVPLPVVGALVDEDTHRRLRARPEVALEVAEGNYVQSVERDVTVASLADMPDEDAIAISECRRLGEFARTGKCCICIRRTSRRSVAISEYPPLHTSSPGHGLYDKFTPDGPALQSSGLWHRNASRSSGQSRFDFGVEQ